MFSISAFEMLKLAVRGRNPTPTMKLAVQFTTTATLVAVGRADTENSSDVMNQGMEPGPIEKKSTNNSIPATER